MNEHKDAPELLHRFLTDSFINKNQSPLTVKEYYRDIMMFLKFVYMTRDSNIKLISEVNPKTLTDELIKDVTSEDINDFMIYLKLDRKTKPTTQSKRLSAIKSFYKYLSIQLKVISENPTIPISKPKIESRLPVYLSLEECDLLLKALEKQKQFKERNYLIVILFLNLGLRLSELVNINLQDIKEENLTVIGKGNKARMLPLNETCLDALNRYYPKRITPKSPSNKNALFISRQGNRISARQIQTIIEKAMKTAGLSYSVHKLRHTAATLMYQTGEVEVLALKKILGHKLVTSTEIYTHVADRQVKSALDINPMNIKKGEKQNER